MLCSVLTAVEMIYLKDFFKNDNKDDHFFMVKTFRVHYV